MNNPTADPRTFHLSENVLHTLILGSILIPVVGANPKLAGIAVNAMNYANEEFRWHAALALDHGAGDGFPRVPRHATFSIDRDQ
jgi:hypothetical protein